jgi:DNA-binding transcriptional MerR regulator
MKIGDLARQTGLSVHTIRYYEKIGLLSYASRNQSRHREYDDSIIVWIEFIGRLKASGMPIKDILQYAELREAGSHTEARRLEFLINHRKALVARLEELDDCLLVLDKKIAGYSTILKRMKEYDAELPKRNRKPPGERNEKARRD